MVRTPLSLFIPIPIPGVWLAARREVSGCERGQEGRYCEQAVGWNGVNG